MVSDYHKIKRKRKRKRKEKEKRADLPRCNFSSRKRDPAIATMRSMRGLKTDTYKGPFIRTHHAVIVTVAPVPTIPYIQIHSFLYYYIYPNLIFNSIIFNLLTSVYYSNLFFLFRFIHFNKYIYLPYHLNF